MLEELLTLGAARPAYLSQSVYVCLITVLLVKDNGEVLQYCC